MISVIVTSRVQGNINSDLKELIRSLSEHSRRPEQIELLIKFDNDDHLAYEMEREIKDIVWPGIIKTAWGLRLRGYMDIHHGYNKLIPLINKKSQIVIAMADDFRVEYDWDSALYKAAEGAGEYFIIHQRPHPLPRDMFLRTKDQARDNFDMSHDMFDSEDLFIIDESPAWSPALLKACAFQVSDHTIFPVSFTDAWTLCLEYVLWHTYQINITKFYPGNGNFINRKTCEVDNPSNVRWHTDRKVNFDYIKSQEFKNIVCDQAMEISCRLRSLQIAK